MTDPFTPRAVRASNRRLLDDDSGAATAEYAIATMAAVAFAGLLVVIMRSDEVRGILTDLVRRALTVG
jgi:Flp pilus assembly pilin Flp